MATSFSDERRGILFELGFRPFSDPEQTELMHAAMRDLYEACRSAGPGQKFHPDDRTFGADWVDMTDATLKLTELAFACIALDDPTTFRNPRSLVRQELEARDWNAVLGFEQPTVRCRIRVHGQKWGIRFQSENAPKGQELRNAQLPATNQLEPEARPDGDAAGVPSDPVGRPDQSTSNDVLEDFVR